MCDLFRRFFPEARINPGVWVEGPDGRRELDLEITEEADGRVVRGVVECKDFNPATTGPVGISYIDALDSKRRDLGIEFAFICSNAGFTADAARKARRVNIGLLGAIRRGDSRIRFGVADEIYIRHLRFTEPLVFRTRPVDGVGADTERITGSGECLFDGGSVLSWLGNKVTVMLARNPVVRGRFQARYRLKSPLTLDWPAGSILVQEIAVEMAIEGAWFAQTGQFEATAGLYDWLRRSMRMAPSPNPARLQITGIDFFAGKWIPQPPDIDWANRKSLPHETLLQFVVMKHVLQTENAAVLDPHVIPEDLTAIITGYGASDIESVPGFKPDRVPDSEIGKKAFEL